MAFYNENAQLYMDPEKKLGVMRDGMQFMRNEAPNNAVLGQIPFKNKNLATSENPYSNKEVLGIPHDLQKFQHFCFAHEVNMITNHKPLAAVFTKNVSSLSHRLQRILPWINKNNVRIYTNQSHNYSLQIGYPDTVKRQTEMKKYQTCT